ncbi:hypothetical protein ACFOGJ_20220 [Marinibaculum pumilum]|uniref:Uncharacterized protein n=1 Tax=Marinibaculum pumilum TaxID=1766165 RepID=A0ABV7L4H6_9PROT
MPKDPLRRLRPEGLIIAAGILAGAALGLLIDPSRLAGLDNALEAYLLAPLIAAVNAGISCF